MLIYKSQDVGVLLCALSPIIPFMYLDAISDGILKGLDQQKFTFFTGLVDSTIRIALILLLLTRFGIYGFIGIMYFSNFFTGILNTKRLIKASGSAQKIIPNFLLPTTCAFTICLVAKIYFSSLHLTNLIYVICICVTCIPLYFIMLYILGVISNDDINFIKRIAKKCDEYKSQL